MTISELNIRLERDVALSLGIPMYGADPRLVDMGSKTGCRRMFEECEVQYPIGAEDLHSVDDIVAAVQGMRARRPSIKHAIVKINEGVSGSGNASMDLDDLPAPGSPDEAAAIAQRLQHIRPEAESLSVDAFLAAFAKGGGIVEERITGVALESPSVQMRALPDGTVELLSTHDQLLGGASGQKYLGCVFPADPGYAAAIAEPAMVVGRHLAQRGVLGRFAVDFVTVKDEAGEWTPVCDRAEPPQGWDHTPVPDAAVLVRRQLRRRARGLRDPRRRHQVSRRNGPSRSDRLKVLTVEDLFDVVVRIGMTAVGDSPEEAWQIYQEAESVLLREADLALEEEAVIH